MFELSKQKTNNAEENKKYHIQTSNETESNIKKKIFYWYNTKNNI